MLRLFPDSATVEAGELVVGGVRATALAAEYETPLLIYCELTVRRRAQAYRRAAPEALLTYGTKAFPNVALMRLLGEEGFGADVSTFGELAYALRAGIPGDRLVVHGNNKSDGELAAAVDAGAGLVVLDALDEVERAAKAGVRRVLVRVTSGVEADTHEAIRTSHHGSKFGLPPESALAAIASGLSAGLDVAGLHVHVGSQLVDTGAGQATVEWLADFSATCRQELDWTPAVIDLGGGLGVSHVEGETVPTIGEFVGELRQSLDREWASHDLPPPRLVLEPGRSLVGRAGVTLYRVGTVKRAGRSTIHVAIDGGMSDNPRPQLYGARYTALLANRADEPSAGAYSVVGKHCESGDVLISRVALPEPRRGDVLAVPATGGYALGLASNFNAVPRPAVVLVADGEARLIRRRETIDDLLALEEPE
jgi:diaminopimelate decarboxylase